MPTLQDFKKAHQKQIAARGTNPRWQDWAYAVTQGTTLARRKWIGKDRPFREKEYTDGIQALLAAGVIVYQGKGGAGGFRPKRAAGWEYIARMARGQAVLPPPPLDMHTAPVKVRHFRHAFKHHNHNHNFATDSPPNSHPATTISPRDGEAENGE